MNHCKDCQFALEPMDHPNCHQCDTGEWRDKPGFVPKGQPVDATSIETSESEALPLQIQRIGGTHDAPLFEASQPAAGRKDDGGKLDVTLFLDDLPNAVEGVTEVMQWAVTKKQPVPYERGSWQAVEPFFRRYRAALLRHQLNAAKSGQRDGTDGFTDYLMSARDAETGLLEIQHIATDAMFLCEMALRAVRQQEKK